MQEIREAIGKRDTGIYVYQSNVNTDRCFEPFTEALAFNNYNTCSYKCNDYSDLIFETFGAVAKPDAFRSPRTELNN